MFLPTRSCSRHTYPYILPQGKTDPPAHPRSAASYLERAAGSYKMRLTLKHLQPNGRAAALLFVSAHIRGPKLKASGQGRLQPLVYGGAEAGKSRQSHKASFPVSELGVRNNRDDSYLFSLSESPKAFAYVVYIHTHSQISTLSPLPSHCNLFRKKKVLLL